MNQRAKFEALEQRNRLMAAAGWVCVVCRDALDSTAQLAHRAAKTKARLDKFGEEVIHSPLNLVPVCSLKCNDRCNIGNRPLEANDLLQRIIRINTGREAMPSLREYYEGLRREFMEEGE